MAQLLKEDSPCYSIVSLDIVGPWQVSRFIDGRQTRGTAGTYKMYGLAIADLLTKIPEIEFMERPTAEEVTCALRSFSTRRRLPSKCISDAGSQFVSAESNPILSGLRSLGIKLETVAPRHQKLNFVERSWKELKGLLSSMRRNPNLSVFNQSDTLVQLQRKLNLCGSIMRATPLLVKHDCNDERVITKEGLMNPYLDGLSLDHKMSDLIKGVAGSESGLLSDILEYNNTIKIVVKEKIISYLQEKGISYPDRRVDGRQTAAPSRRPQPGDVVGYKDSSNKLHLGIVENLEKKSVVRMRIIKRGKPDSVATHLDLIKLIYRPEDSQQFSVMTYN